MSLNESVNKKAAMHTIRTIFDKESVTVSGNDIRWIIGCEKMSDNFRLSVDPLVW